jgi:hypothetical protein
MSPIPSQGQGPPLPSSPKFPRPAPQPGRLAHRQCAPPVREGRQNQLAPSVVCGGPRGTLPHACACLRCGGPLRPAKARDAKKRNLCAPENAAHRYREEGWEKKIGREMKRNTEPFFCGPHPRWPQGLSHVSRPRATRRESSPHLYVAGAAPNEGGRRFPWPPAGAISGRLRRGPRRRVVGEGGEEEKQGVEEGHRLFRKRWGRQSFL